MPSALLELLMYTFVLGKHMVCVAFYAYAIMFVGDSKMSW